MKRELKNAIFSLNFLFSVLITAAVFLIALGDTAPSALYKKTDVLYMFNICMQLSPLFVFIPFVATLPYGYRFIDEYNSSFFRFSLSRSGYTRYALSKVLAVTLSAFLAVFTGLTLCIVLFIIIARPLDTGDVIYLQLYNTLLEGRTYGSLLGVNVYLYIFTYILFISLFSTLWPIIGMISSTYFKNRYVSLVMPFTVFFLSWQILVRIAHLVPALSRFLLLYNVYYGEYGLFHSPVLSFISTVAFVLIWHTLLFLWFKKRIRTCA